MKTVEQTALLPWPAAAMFDLVNDVSKYQDFLPGCEQSQVLSVTDAEMVARLTLARAGIRQTFITRNLLTPPDSIHITLVEGPFSMLEGEWRFTPIQQAMPEQAMKEQTIQNQATQARSSCQSYEPSQHPTCQGPYVQQRGCRVDMHLEFDFASRLVNLAVARMFEAVTSKMVDAFCKRADALYG